MKMLSYVGDDKHHPYIEFVGANLLDPKAAPYGLGSLVFALTLQITGGHHG